MSDACQAKNCSSVTSVADPGCLSRFPDPGSRIPYPKTATKERCEKKLDVKPFYVATKFNKIGKNFSFEVLKKKIWANFQRIIELFTKKNCQKLFKIWSWDPGVKKAPDPESRIRIRNTVCDNLSSHVSLEVISLCRENNIE
jgi:hypothetical protein